MAGGVTGGRWHREASRSGVVWAGAAASGVLAAGLAVAACGSSASGGAQAYQLEARSLSGLGEIITDGTGFTLYMYAPDHQGPSQCYRFCAQQWPPLVLPHGVDTASAGPGVRAGLLGTVRRSNGQLQVTYNGWPLYLWQGDTAPGQATGQGYDMGLWYAMSVTGAVDRGTPRG